jgi:hypothetical protein
VTVVGDRRALTQDLFASQSPCKIQRLPNCPTAVWGFTGANILAPEIAERVDFVTNWDDALSGLCSALFIVNLHRELNMQVSAVLGGINNAGRPAVAHIDATGTHVEDGESAVFVGSVASHAKASWLAFEFLKSVPPTDKRLDAVYRGLVAAGSVAIAYPLDVATISVGDKGFGDFKIVG